MDDSNSRTFACGFFFTRRLSKSLAFYEFASVNFEPCQHQIVNSIKTCQKWVIPGNWTSTTVQTKRASFVFTLRTEKQYESMLQNLSSFRLLRSASHKLFIQQLFSFLSVLKKDYHFKLLLFLNWKVTDTDVFVDKLPNTNGTWLYDL